MKHIFLLLGLCSLIACTNELEESVPSNEVNQITMTVKDFELDNIDSRMSVDVSTSGAVFKWSENDTVGIFPNEGAQAYFPMTNGAGTNKASFTGGGWALKSSSKYAAYYPYNFYNRDLKKIEVNYDGQTQKGNGSTAHLGAYDYMAAVATTPSSGKVNFEFQHLGCLVEMNITLPKGYYSGVKLTCDEDVFVTKACVDLSSPTLAIAPIATLKSLEIKLDNMQISAKQEQVKIYFMCAPVDLTGKTIHVSFNTGGTWNRFKLVGDNWIAGKVYSVAPIAEEDLELNKWVDLGLPSGLLWATCNVGANSPQEYGDYFAWGEITPKESYEESNSLTYGKTMKDFSGDPQYDAATANWGAPARMPSEKEIRELTDNCSYTWVAGKGYSVLGPNGNSIFLPAADFGVYWSSTPFEYDNFYAWHLSINEGNVFSCMGNGNRSQMGSIRPVRD